MNWQFFLLINLLAASTREFLNKKIVTKVDSFVMSFYLLTFNGLFLYLYQFISQKRMPRFDFWAGTSGLLFVGYFVCYFLAVKISLSQSILFQSYSIAVTIILSALFLGESKYFDVTNPAGLKIVGGIILAFISLWFLLHTGKKKEEKLERKWFFYMIIVIVSMGVGAFFSIFFSQTYQPAEVFISQTYLAFPLIILLLLCQKKSLKISKKSLLFLLINSFFSTVSALSFYATFQTISLAKILPIQQVLLVIITMINSVLFLKEGSTFTGKKLAGMILGLTGIILLVTS